MSPSESQGNDNKEAAERPLRASATVAAPQSASTRTALTGLGGLVVGLLAGIFIGKNLRADGDGLPGQPASSPPAQASAVASSVTSTATVAAAPGGAGSHLDLGTLPVRSALERGWNALTRLDGRTVALTTAATAALSAQAAAGERPSALAAVARSHHLEKGQTLKAVVSVGDQDIASWSVGADWALFSAVVPDEALSADATAIAFKLTVEGPDGQPVADSWSAVSSGLAPAMAVDYLRLGPLPDAAGVDLNTPWGRAQLLTGFWPVERAGGDQMAAWSRGLRSSLGVVLDPGSAGYVLKLYGYAFEPLAPLGVELRINGKSTGTVEIGELNEYLYDIPADALVTGANTIELIYPRSARPADELPGASDARDLALRLYAVALVPEP